jgi:2-oxoisovalerate dehydrogenase E1 component
MAESLEFYRQMLTIRRFEETLLRLSRDGAVAGSIHLCGGQEAIPVGTVAALQPDDKVISTYRGHGWALAKGVPIDGLLAEIAGRTTGINGGRGGSAYFTAPEYGFMGENSIVGGGVPIAGGIAMSQKLRGTGGVCVASIGDGAMNQGATNEAMAFAAALALPLIIVVENNGWSEMTPISATTLVDDLARRADGFGIWSMVADGTDPVTVTQAVAVAAQRCRDGAGPALLEFKTVRLMAHYNGDIEHYRTTEERQSDQQRDPLVRAQAALIALGHTDDELKALDEEVTAQVEQTAAHVLGDPMPDPATARDHVYVATSTPVANTSVTTTTRNLTYAQAVNEALRTELRARTEMVLYGEDIAVPGGVFGVTRGLHKEFGVERVFDTPITESAILGSAIGAAMTGLRPVVEIMWADFMLVALDQLVNQAANVSYISRGSLRAPMVVRMQQGATPGSCAQHSQSLEALLAHIPGLRVGLPSTPQDAYTMLRTAIASDDPCIIIEARGLYKDTASVTLGGDVPTLGHPSGAVVRRTGGQYGLITWGTAAPKCVAAADALAQSGLAVGVLDLRWLNPLDDESIADFVRASGGHVAVVHDANITGGFGAEIAARIAQRSFFDLDAPVERIATPDSRIPASPALQDALIPSADHIASRVRELASRYDA